MIWLLLACAKDVEETAQPITDYSQAGPYQPAQRRITLDGERPLTVEIWYPSEEAASGGPVAEVFLSDPERIAAYQSAMQGSCATEQTQAGWELQPLTTEQPLLVFSHCHECLRFSSFSVAEHLATWGFVVAAADHVGNSFWEKDTEQALGLNTDTLALRLSDQERVLDALLSQDAVPVDPERLAAFGHSFGSVTSGLLAQEDLRIQGALGLAAPMENPLLPGVETSTLDKPLAILLAVEDNSITALGNQLIVSNLEDAPNTTYRLDVADAGHWSVSDIAGIHPDVQAGCGSDERMTDGADFEYLDPALGSAIAGHFTAAFMAELLLDDAGAVSAQDFDGALVE